MAPAIILYGKILSTRKKPDGKANSTYPDSHRMLSKPSLAKKFDLKPIINKTTRSVRTKRLRMISLRLLF